MTILTYVLRDLQKRFGRPKKLFYTPPKPTPINPPPVTITMSMRRWYLKR